MAGRVCCGVSRSRLTGGARRSGRSFGPTGSSLISPEVSRRAAARTCIGRHADVDGGPLRTAEDWDEFPNGRWGDSRSPAYGDLDGYPVKIDVPGNDALELWGEPRAFSDITALFAKFCRNELKALPWSSQPASKETSVIDQQLAKMNELGFLTINSQPAVDGAKSEDATHGWGPAGGYCYQKAYLEFFVAPNLLDELVKRIEKDPRITYYAVNRQGDLRTNTHSEGPNAVTWGVFPGKEIIQASCRLGIDGSGIGLIVFDPFAP